jgi:osmotically-inducible protein OsmY
MFAPIRTFHEESDRDLERRVTAFLAERNVPALRRLNVESQRGVVTLRGRVQTFYEKQIGSHVVRRVAGVVELVDDVQVAADESFSDPRPPRQLPWRVATLVLAAALWHSAATAGQSFAPSDGLTTFRVGGPAV